MNISPELLIYYLKHLGFEKREPDYEFLTDLIRSQIVKFPFENISKLIQWHENGNTGIPDLKTYVFNSKKFGGGGTCYSSNYYFYRLLLFLGFNASLHGANMKVGVDVHLVSIVRFDNKKYLVDVGYGAPFYKPLPLSTNQPTIINWGCLKYKLTEEHDGHPKMNVSKGDVPVHDYIVNLETRQFDHFQFNVKNSYRDNAEFMRRLRVIKYFKNYSIDLKNFVCSVNNAINQKSFVLKDIEEVEKIIKNEFMLPHLPIKKAYRILTEVRGLNINDDSYSY
ncbi:arylamine N-acetyltransferase [Bacteroidota bacterium]